jgi:2-polyprenyl-3-methyl-5-hydroxy-6-metoxy-1,4-benzoquinol methylase
MAADVSCMTYQWNASTPHTEAYLLKPLHQLMDVALSATPGSVAKARILDLGCGNGSLCTYLYSLGHEVVGIEPSPSGVAASRTLCPELEIHQAMASPTELARLNLPPFDLVISTEVVEHCYSPRDWAACSFQALRPGGWLICSTPYHGYLKNLTLAGTGRLDSHFTALWDGGHIKFWSRRTLSTLLGEAGFVDLQFRGAGRLLWLWKSMLMAARRP